jgi:hypothetical protein
MTTTPKQLANLRPGVGRPPTDNEQIKMTIPRSLLAQIDRICQQQGWKRSYVIEVYLKKGLNLAEFGGYSDDDLTLIAKGAPIE